MMEFVGSTSRSQGVEIPGWKGEGKMQLKRLAGAFLVVALLTASVAGPASAAKQVGLVNVEVGDITIEDAIDVNAAAVLVATLCPNVSVDVIVGVISAIAAGDTKQATFCKTDTGQVKVTQSTDD
jgi:hypothetical protein